MTGPHTDTELGSKRDMIRVANTIKVLKQHELQSVLANFDTWFDVGAGDSLMRRALATLAGCEPTTTTHNLDYRNDIVHADLITSIEVIEHLLNPLQHMEWIRECLSPQGLLYLTTPNDHSLIYKAEHLLSKKYAPHFHQFSESDLRELCRRSGIDVITLRKFRRSAGMGTLARISYNGLLLIGARA